MKKSTILSVGILCAMCVGLAFSATEFLKGQWFAASQLYPAIQTIGAGGTIAADACGGLKRITSTADRTTSTTNSFTAPATKSDTGNAGCTMDVVNVGDYAITIDYNALFNGAGAANVVLGSSDTVRVASDGAMWYQVSGTGDN